MKLNFQITRNWKTTLAGIFGGITLAAPQIQACLAGQPCDKPQLLAGIAVAILGTFAKDGNVSGK